MDRPKHSLSQLILSNRPVAAGTIFTCAHLVDLSTPLAPEVRLPHDEGPAPGDAGAAGEAEEAPRLRGRL